MDTCPYYRERGTKPDAIPCCMHKHTPAPCFRDTPLAVGPHVLACGGRVSKCEIPANQQLDPS
jgi:hypothetical protein